MILSFPIFHCDFLHCLLHISDLTFDICCKMLRIFPTQNASQMAKTTFQLSKEFDFSKTIPNIESVSKSQQSDLKPGEYCCCLQQHLEEFIQNNEHH